MQKLSRQIVSVLLGEGLSADMLSQMVRDVYTINLTHKQPNEHNLFIEAVYPALHASATIIVQKYASAMEELDTTWEHVTVKFGANYNKVGAGWGKWINTRHVRFFVTAAEYPQLIKALDDFCEMTFQCFLSWNRLVVGLRKLVLLAAGTKPSPHGRKIINGTSCTLTTYPKSFEATLRKMGLWIKRLLMNGGPKRSRLGLLSPRAGNYATCVTLSA